MGLFGDVKDALFGDSPRVDWPSISPEESRLVSERTGLTEDYIKEVGRVYGEMRDAFSGFEDFEDFEPFEQTEAEVKTSGLLRDRLESILRGETTREDEAVEQDISREYEKMENEMNKRLGPNWRTSTPGIQSLRAFNEWAERSRSENRMMQKGLEQDYTGTLGGLLDAESNRNLDIFRTNEEANIARTQLQNQMGMTGLGLLPQAFSQIDPIVGYHIGNRQMKMGQKAANAGLQQSQQAGAMNMLGTGLGLLPWGQVGGAVGNIFTPQSRTGMLSQPTTMANARWSPR